MTTKPNDGGPAFPLPITKDHLGVVITTAELNTEKCGMTLRDWFAGMALQAIIENAERFNDECRARCSETRIREVDVAQKCYIYADAMIAERSKTV